MISASGLVTTIIPVFDRAKMAAEAVESVLAQDYRPIEIIVVDDGSSNAQARLLDQLVDNRGVRVVRQENQGPGAARETGRKLAQGEFIQYLDSDDLLLPGKFAAQVKALRDDPSCGVAYGMTRFRGADGAVVEGAWKGSGEKVETMFPSFLVSRWWDTPNPLYRRKLCDRAGPWMTTRLEEDWEYDCRVAALGVRLAYVPTFVCEVRDHAADRLSRGGLEPQRLADRALAHQQIFLHAVRAGISPQSPEMRHFARALFLLARQCGEAGLESDAKTLFRLARDASEPHRATGWDFRAYAVTAALLGWRQAGKLSAWVDRRRQ
ncbi:MAG: glycosyltransferase family 2 protein [Methylocystis sp.]|nr:glycosyltransferase family 2 protein [Methylocystis sp.]